MYQTNTYLKIIFEISCNGNNWSHRYDVQFSDFSLHIRFLLDIPSGEKSEGGEILLIYVALIIALPKFIRSLKLGAGEGKEVDRGRKGIPA